MTRRKVFLHIGLPGTGAGFVEQALLSHAAALADAGVDVAAASTEEMLRVAIEIRRDHKDWGYQRSEVEGTWAEVCRRIYKLKGTVVISQELLAGASHDQVSLFLDGLAGREIHVIVTVRDPGTQVAAGWQESVKSGDSVTFGRFHERIMDPDRGHAQARQFWNAQELVDVLGRWSSVKAERVHLVAVPQVVDPRPAIWASLARIVGFDADRFAPDVARASQPTLGTTEVAVLRGVNEAIDGRIDGQLRRTVVKRYFADRILGDTSTPPATTPPELYDELLARAEGWQKFIANRGYDVIGQVDDLLPRLPSKSALSPDDVPVKERLRTTTNALANVLVEVARLREHNEQLEIRNEKLERKRKKLKRKLAERPPA
ncbi:conserved hypothetical protein [metagenome]|uniref:Uncharacterized protein n=1 Tax=metagenome TaxID=256318 RepID=A0A2P2BYK1_9ZZZZ